MHDLVIGIDSSTTATKAIVWDRNGGVASEGRQAVLLATPRPGWAEQNPEDWWTACAGAVRQALAGVAPDRIAAVAVANQRETMVPVDEKGRPLRPAILWLDERCRDQLARIERLFGASRIHRLTGKPVDVTPTVYRILWLQEHERDVAKRAARYLDVHAFLVQRLTGHCCTSLASADPMGLVDMEHGLWAADLLEAIGLGEAHLPALAPPGVIIGVVTAAAAEATGLPKGTPVVAGGGYGQCAALGAGVTQPGRAYLNLGTALVSGLCADRYAADPAFRTLYGCINGTFIYETVVRSGTYLVSWFVKHILALDGDRKAPPEDLLEAMAAAVPPGANGLMVVPYWLGSMMPHWDASARGVTLGWSPVHGRAHFYRAILEGLLFEQHAQMEAVEAASGLRVQEHVLTGGGSRSIVWSQMAADIIGCPAVRCRTFEATSLGAAILAAAGAGLYPDVCSAVAAMSTPGERLEPHPERARRYAVLYRVYRDVFPTMRPLVDHLSALAGEDGSSATTTGTSGSTKPADPVS